MMNRREICRGMLMLVAAAVATTHAEKSEVPDDAISLKVGQVLYVAFSSSGDGLINPRILPEAAPSTEPTVTLQLTQSGPTRTLLVTNGYARTLSYRAVARMRGRRRQFEAPVNPVRPGLQSIMTLGEPFDELLLYEFHLSDSP